MIQDRKIDLALEAKELAEGSAAQTTRLAGVKAQEDTVFGYPGGTILNIYDICKGKKKEA